LTEQAPIVSVVLPTYNSAATIENCLESISRSAGSTAYEVILVDDASDDIETLGRICEPFTNLKIVRKTLRTNAAHSRNIGFETARAKLVFFLDSDDEYAPDHMRNRIDAAKRGDWGIMFGGFQTRKAGVLRSYAVPFRGNDMADYLFGERGDVRSSTIVINREHHKGALFDERLGKHQDWAFAIAADRRGERIAFDPRTTVIIDLDGAGRMSAKSNPQLSLDFMHLYVNPPSRPLFLLGRLKGSVRLGDVPASARFLRAYLDLGPGFAQASFARALYLAARLRMGGLLARFASVRRSRRDQAGRAS